MYHRFIVQGGYTCVATSEALALLECSNSEWKILQTPIGTLYSVSNSVEDVVVNEHTVRLDRDKSKRNHYASDFFGFDVYGDWYLKTVIKKFDICPLRATKPDSVVSSTTSPVFSL